MTNQFYQLIVITPLDAAAKVREALGKAGAGSIGNYDYCSFSLQGTGRFRPNENAKPAIGTKGIIEEVAEERVEVIVPAEKIKEVLEAVLEVHPYEEPAIHVIPMIDYHSFC
ncbi:hypothetical protein KKC44_03035 [Patescibacteria group bacterium]|nr:hypothetical protein [Patescibacteria group bacterium]MBU2259560.1 hypothetical protein [Patescibacteria group bacterium]